MSSKKIIIISALLLLAGCGESNSSKLSGAESNLTPQSYSFKSCPDISGNYRCTLNGKNGNITLTNEPSTLTIKQYKSSNNTPFLDIDWDGTRRVLVSDGAVRTSTRQGITFEYSTKCSETSDEIFLHMVRPAQLWTKQTFRYFGRFHVEVDTHGVNENGPFDLKMDCY